MNSPQRRKGRREEKQSQRVHGFQRFSGGGDDSTAKSNFTTEGTESTEIRRRRIPEHFLLNPLLSLLLTSVFSVSSVVAILLFAVESEIEHRFRRFTQIQKIWTRICRILRIQKTKEKSV